MFNIKKTMFYAYSYIAQKDSYLKSGLFSLAAITFVVFIRRQISEIDLLQLAPGYYLVLIFCFFIFLAFVSQPIFLFCYKLDNKKELGTKAVQKLQTDIFFVVSFLLIFLTFFFGINTLIPLSLDCFNLYSESALENIWSFDEVFNLEAIFLILLLLLCQLPLMLSYFFLSEKQLIKWPKFWKQIILLSIVIAGVITPTIDGYTQLSLSLFSITYYLIIMGFAEKREGVKFAGLNSINS